MNTTKSIPAMLLVAGLSLLTPPTAPAATYYIGTNGSDANTGEAGAPFRTIAKGIAVAAANGDTLLVTDGTYNEHGLDLGTKNLVLQSQSGNPAACVLDCQFLANGLFIRGGQTFATTISGLTLQNAVAFGTPFSGSFGSSAMYVSNSSVTLSNCIFRNNNTVAANGLLIGPGGRAAINNCRFVTTVAEVFSGGVLSARGDGLAVVDCAFEGNACSSLSAYSGNSIVTRCNFTGNNRSGIDIRGGTATITECSLVGNHGVAGGGLYMNGGTASIANTSFTNNDGHNFGGAIGLEGGHLTVQNCRLIGNRVQTKGGAIAVSNARLILKNCLIARNTSDFGWGCALLLDTLSGANVGITNCTITGNFSGGQTSSEIIFFNQGASLSVANSIVWNNITSPAGVQFAANNNGVTTVTYTDVLGGYVGVGNINTDPLFVAASTNNYRLQAASPCINAGHVTLDLSAIDLDGAPRIMGSAPDLGTYETWSPDFGAWCVDTQSGDDGNNGSPATPFQTVTRAFSASQIGESIHIRQGNYGSDQPRITQNVHLRYWGETGLARIGAP